MIVKRILVIDCKLYDQVYITLAHFDCKVSGGRIAFGQKKFEAKSSLASTIVCFCFKVFGRGKSQSYMVPVPRSKV